MAKRQARPVDIEVVDAPASPDQQLVTTDGDKLREFLGGLSTFFKRAGELERAAKERLDRARQLTAPTDAASDEKLQVFIRETKTEITTAEEHWTITAVVHNLHRRLTSARGRTTGKDSKGIPIGMLDQAGAIAQTLHNRYVEDAKRKAREEEDRLRREAEERARQDRERELARLEEEAVKAEAASADLSERETSFTKLVAAGGNSSDAARTVGYKDPDAQAARLLKAPKIVAAIESLRQAANLRKQAAATAAMPVEVEKVEVRPDITRAAGSYDLTTWSGEVFDEDALVAAVLDPRTRATLGIPSDIVTIKATKINEYAGSMQELINKWPGVRAVKKTTTVGR
jgi:hypothetical protein